MNITPVNPSTGSSHASLDAATKEEVLNAVQGAQNAFNSWKYLSHSERSAFLYRAADILESRSAELGEIITSEMGRVISESVPEVIKAANFIRYFCDNAESILKDESIELGGLAPPEKSGVIKHTPRGVVAVIKPWNAPIQQVIWGVAPALLAGCTVVIKPSEYTPRSLLALQKVFDDAELPSNVCNTIVGADETGRFLVESGVDVIAFTGSVHVGRQVAEIAGRNIKKTVLELSGKDSLIVDENISGLDLVSSGIVYGAFSNCGHWCSSVERAFIPASIYDDLVDEVMKKTKNLRVGDPMQKAMDIGPIANERQFSIVSDMVEDALSKGAETLIGGSSIDGAGYFFQPTILTGVTPDMKIHRENVFGPVLVMEKYENIDDAIAMANDTNYGLGMSVWTDSEAFADYVTNRSDTGMVWINEPLHSIAACPWSVCKDSGIGSELGAAGMKEFTFPKVVNRQYSNNSTPRPWYFPYGE
ncbi:aldehyde dehydrogenase family protein [Granulosicoccus sp.]|nr:aldehyde dehydrogenase family protein [Granulosicoccus sp.]MDB4223369.1 aldehyde dehydrogenase family protein [Granulosicoccus sp.]